MFDVDRCVEISVRAVATDHTAKRLLIGPVSSVWIVAHAALLRGICALDSDRRYASLSGIPGNLPGDVRQVGGVEIGVHGGRLVLHGGHRNLFTGQLPPPLLSHALVYPPLY